MFKFILLIVTLIGISKVKSIAHQTDADGIVLIANGTMKYFTNVHQVIYEMDATILFDFVDLIVNIFSLLTAANQMYSEKFRCERMWNNRDFDILYESKLDYIDTRRNREHVDTAKYFKDNENYLKFKVKSNKFNVIHENLMHDLYKIHKKLDNITYSPKAQYSVYGPRPVLTKFLQKAYDVSMNAVRKYQPILLKLHRMNVTDLVEYDSQFVTLIHDMQKRANNTFSYDPVRIFDSFRVINDKTMVYVVSNIYITHPTLYTVNIVHSLLVRHLRSSLTTSLNKPGDILCDSLMSNGDYFYMSWEQNAKCFMEREQKICPLNPKLKSSVTERDCIYSIHRNIFDISLCSKDLMYSKYIQKTTFQQLDSNAWYYYIHSSGVLTIECGVKISENVITETGLIMLDDDCYASVSENGEEEVFLFKDLSKETEFNHHLISHNFDEKYKEMLVKKNIFKRLDSKAW